MYVADRDTRDDVFCRDCGNIASRETLTADGLCEDCTAPKIAELNDEFRRGVLRAPQPNGKAIMTAGVARLAELTRMFILAKVIAYNEWDTGNDPNGEHDFGVVQISGVPKIYFKIDYYEDASMEYGTKDKINAYRVLVIMLAEEY